MIVFIDTSIYLTFYHFTSDDLEELRKLLVAIKNGDLTLCITDQVISEFKRNRENKIADALKRFNEQKAPTIFPQICKDYPEYERLRRLVEGFEVYKSQLIEKLKTDIQGKTLRADRIISDLFDAATKITITDEIIDRAKRRFDRGNPPGKDGSYGDAINWESLLSGISEKTDLHIIVRDKDYVSIIDSNHPSEYLADEWKSEKKAKLYYYPELSNFLGQHFPKIKLAVDFERKLCITNLKDSMSFAGTHVAIAKLSQYSDFSNQDIEELCEILLSNNQVYGISEDEDVHAFVLWLITTYESIIDAEKLTQIIKKYSLSLSTTNL